MRDREWIYRLELAPAGVGRVGRKTRPGLLRFARLQIGARVASPQSPILRWSKGSVSHFRVKARGS
jgi:hypothetical protein